VISSGSDLTNPQFAHGYILSASRLNVVVRVSHFTQLQDEGMDPREAVFRARARACERPHDGAACYARSVADGSFPWESAVKHNDLSPS